MTQAEAKKNDTQFAVILRTQETILNAIAASSQDSRIPKYKSDLSALQDRAAALGASPADEQLQPLLEDTIALSNRIGRLLAEHNQDIERSEAVNIGATKIYNAGSFPISRAVALPGYRVHLATGNVMIELHDEKVVNMHKFSGRINCMATDRIRMTALGLNTGMIVLTDMDSNEDGGMDLASPIIHVECVHENAFLVYLKDGRMFTVKDSYASQISGICGVAQRTIQSGGQLTLSAYYMSRLSSSVSWNPYLMLGSPHHQYIIGMPIPSTRFIIGMDGKTIYVADNMNRKIIGRREMQSAVNCIACDEQNIFAGLQDGDLCLVTIGIA